MKRINYFLAFVIASAISIFIYSCKKDNNVQEEQKYVPIDFSKVKIGDLHNQYVTAAYNKIKSKLNNGLSQRSANAQQYYDIIVDEFSNIPYDPTPLGYTHTQFMTRAIQMTDSLSSFQYDVRNWNYSYVTQNASLYVGQILSEVEAATSLTDIYQRLSQIEANATANLTNVDFDIVKGTLEIARSSAYLWSPESEGGYDLLTKTFGNSPIGGRANSSSRVQLSWWKRALVGDISASAQYFLGIGIGGSISAAFIPGTNAVLLGGWAISAGLGSAAGALGI
jgi:hypothetical protein